MTINVEAKEYINPYSKQITYNYNAIWDLLLSICHETLVDNIDADSILTRTEIVDYLFKLYVVYDANSGAVVKDFLADGTRGTGGVAVGLAVKSGTDFELLDYNTGYTTIVQNKRDIKNILLNPLAMSPDPVLNKKILSEYLTIEDRADVVIKGSGGSTTYNVSGALDFYVVNIWRLILKLGNFFLDMDFHLTLVSIYDDYMFNNVSSFIVPDEADVDLYIPYTSLISAYRVGATDNDCRTSYSTLFGDAADYDIAEIGKLNTLYSLSNLGMTGELNTNLLARDFKTSKAELINYISQYYPELWNHFYDSNIGTVFLDVMAYINDVLNNYIDRNLRESFLLTAQEPANIRAQAEYGGMDIPSATSAVTQAKFKLDAVSIKGSPLAVGDKVVIYPDMDILNEDIYTVTSSGLTFNLFMSEDTDNILDIDEEHSMFYFTLPLKEGALKKDTFSAVGKDFESFKTTNSPVAGSNFRVYVNGTEKKISQSFEVLESLITDSDGIYKYNEDGRLEITFGNNKLGTQLQPADQVVIVYLKSLGEKGNALPLNSLIGQSVTCKIISGILEYTGDAIVASNSESGGGETIVLSNRDTYPIALNMQMNNRLVSEDDLNAFVRNFRGKNGSKLKGMAFLDTADASANVIKFPLLIPTGQYSYSEFTIQEGISGRIYPAIITEFLTNADAKKIKTNRYEVLSGVIQELNIYVDLTLEQQMPKDTIHSRIREALMLYFSNVDFGKSAYLSDMYFEVETILREFAPKTYLENSCEISWKYKNQTVYTKEPKISFNYDELETAQKNKLIAIFGDLLTAQTYGMYATLMGVKQNNIVFNIVMKGYKKAKLELA